MLKAIAFFLCFISLGYFSTAQDSAAEKIEADRPGAGENPGIVHAKYFQVETGCRKTHDVSESGHEDIYTYPSVLLKYGLSKIFELRFLAEHEQSYDHTPYKHRLSTGFSPLEVGVKANILKGKSAIPQTSLLAHFAIPSLHPEEKSHIAPILKLLMQNELTDKLTLSYNAGVEWETDNNHPKYLFTTCTQFSLTKFIDVFAEVYGFYSKDEVPDDRFDAGIACRVKKNVQLDVSAGWGVTENAPDKFIDFGIAFRLPK